MNLDTLLELTWMPDEHEVRAIREMPDDELKWLDEVTRRFDRMGERARFELRRRRKLNEKSEDV